MDQEKSPFEEIFKREEKRKKEKVEEDKGILEVLDREENNILEEESPEVDIGEKKQNENLVEEERYRNLIEELLEHHYFGEAISIINEMKTKF